MHKLTVREQEIVSLLEKGWDSESHHTEIVHLIKDISQSSFPHQQKTRSSQRQ